MSGAQPQGIDAWIRPASCEVRCWFDGEAVLVFHVPSGQTHYLNRSAWELFERLDATPRSAGELATALLHGGAAASEQGSMLESVHQSLRILDHLGMIEAASCA